MKNIQFYKYATIGLLVLNLSMIAFFFFTKPKPLHSKNRQDLSKTTIDILNLDQQQNTKFLQSAKEHQQQMKRIDSQQIKLLEPYFTNLLDSKNDVNSDTLLQQIQQLERNKIELTYQHFEEVKLMLNEEQKDDFELFITHALQMILSQKKKYHPPPKEF